MSYRIIAELGFSTPVIMGLTGLPFAMILSPLQRTAHVGSVDISAKHAVNLVLLVLYIWLLIESAYQTLSKYKLCKLSAEPLRAETSGND